MESETDELAAKIFLALIGRNGLEQAKAHAEGAFKAAEDFMAVRRERAEEEATTTEFEQAAQRANALAALACREGKMVIDDKPIMSGAGIGTHRWYCPKWWDEERINKEWENAVGWIRCSTTFNAIKV